MGTQRSCCSCCFNRCCLLLVWLLAFVRCPSAPPSVRRRRQQCLRVEGVLDLCLGAFLRFVMVAAQVV